jgi:RNA-directed DNA polymerase
LTSQIFANLYLNEFDRYVRHIIKPLGYVRYGDDFVLLVDNQKEAILTQSLVAKWLSKHLHLTIHKQNNVVVRASQGLHFLGHQIYPSGIAVDRAMAEKIKQKVDRQNAGSYRAMHLSPKQAKQLPWLL